MQCLQQVLWEANNDFTVARPLSGYSSTWLEFGNLLFEERGKNGVAGKKPFGAKERTNNILISPRNWLSQVTHSPKTITVSTETLIKTILKPGRCTPFYYMAESVFAMRLVNLRSVTCYTDQNAHFGALNLFSSFMCERRRNGFVPKFVY